MVSTLSRGGGGGTGISCVLLNFLTQHHRDRSAVWQGNRNDAASLPIIHPLGVIGCCCCSLLCIKQCPASGMTKDKHGPAKEWRIVSYLSIYLQQAGVKQDQSEHFFFFSLFLFGGSSHLFFTIH